MNDLFDWIGIVAVTIGPIWIILHYVTKWKHASRITPEDETLLDEMYNLARRLEDRVQTVERIVAADHPEFRAGLAAPAPNDWQRGIPAGQSSYQPARRN